MRENKSRLGRGEPSPVRRALLLSLQPRFASAILSETKTVELRRKAPTLAPGAKVLLYSSTPVKAIVGQARLTHVSQFEPDALWSLHGPDSGVTISEFETYFDGTDTAYGLHLDQVQRASVEVSLEDMRRLQLTPPQSWRYLNETVTDRLVTLMDPLVCPLGV